MAYLVNPIVTYVLIVVGVTLLFITMINPKAKNLKIGMVICLVGAGIELLFLRVNPWAFLVVVLSPFPFLIGVRQARPQNPLFLLAICMLAIGSFYLFADQDNPLLIKWAWVSVLCAAITWIYTGRLRNVEGASLSNDSGSVVGLIGEVVTDIETHSAGSVLIDGEMWQARSETPIPAGSTVRVLRQDGFWLTVKKANKLTKDK
jgi:membrane-bound serine protease (ClpP class)